jgi:hypothetical protein
MSDLSTFSFEEHIIGLGADLFVLTEGGAEEQ